MKEDGLNIRFIKNPSKLVQLEAVKKDGYVKTSKLPSDYIYYNRVSLICSNGNCNNIQINSSLIEEGNVNDLLSDDFNKPSLDFEQAFHTIVGNTIKAYHNNEFDINEVKLIYYKTPKRLPFTKDKEYTFDFKDDLMELFIDKGVQIMSGDIESPNQTQLSAQRVDNGK